MRFPHKGRDAKVRLDEIYDGQYQFFLERLRQARIEAGLSQEEVADRLGVSQSFVSRSERGERKVDIIELQAFSIAYSKPISYFFQGYLFEGSKEQ